MVTESTTLYLYVIFPNSEKLSANYHNNI